MFREGRFENYADFADEYDKLNMQHNIKKEVVAKFCGEYLPLRLFIGNQ